jgi:hypothetical protein
MIYAVKRANVDIVNMSIGGVRPERRQQRFRRGLQSLERPVQNANVPFGG